MSDNAIDTILSYTGTINYKWLRLRFMSDEGLKDSLGYGHAVLDSTLQLNQYLYTYGPMIESQWTEAMAHIGSLGQPELWIDYGCGQGLAGVLLSDLTGTSVFDNVRRIILIEPSARALARAAAVYGRLAPAATVVTVNKRFEEVSEGDAPQTVAGHTLHLFSNSMDIPTYDALGLLAKTVRGGRHTLVSVSHDREFNGGTPRIERIKAAMESVSGAGLTIQRTVFERFTCDNPGQSKGVVWLCDFEASDG